ncbi:hypothetical protein NAEGRDRAFT_80857 [Naegleria gruberi]|uniref:MATH domain-containing protein n=1 Tax=Naegleria gruberi TaxID=5762 RepID=D2VQE4_NAEGR|nr:uncharacterized protein NAEGRDRAFT_80857 [Naegleria gruberi]EFC40931.1 hypothetical protein NAEGRDRAFT_80857 [Naegleria gruberi]|eukprot:XP_002673675.1 hypothetical protein NAEGRDRAFT_80857 [Naegleria gruberi strain NEG-M]
MKLQDLPFELCRDHLLCFLDEDYLFPMRLVSKIFSDWIWCYLVEKKSKYFIHVSVDNNQLTKVVDNYLIKLKNLKCIDLFSFGEINFLLLTDVGLYEIGRLTTIEELYLDDALKCTGSFMANWILNGSQLLHSIKVMELSNVKCEYFHLFKEFNNLKTLELQSNETISDTEMNETIIELPMSLESLSINYPLTQKNIQDIVRTSPNLKEFSFLATNLDDEDVSFILSSYSKIIEKFKMFIDESLSLEGKYLSVFSDFSFPCLKKIRIYWPFTDNPKVKSLQRSLFIPTLDKLRIFFNDGESSAVIDPLLTFIIRHNKLTSLHLDFMDYPSLEIKNERLIESLNNLSLKSVSIFGGFNLENYKEILINLMTGSNLEKLKWCDKELSEENQFVFLKDSMKSLHVLKLSGSLTESTVSSSLEELRSYSLEKVYGSSIFTSCIGFLPISLKFLDIIVNSPTRNHLKNLKDLVNLTSLKIEMTETIQDFNELRLPKSLGNIGFVCGEDVKFTGLEDGLLEALLSAENLRTLSFNCCSIKDDFIKGIVPYLKERLEILKILYNEEKALTIESTYYLSQFTRCRTLLLNSYDPSITSSIFSSFEHDNPRITIIFKHPYPESRKFYPKLNYENIEQVVSYTKQRISVREMKDASLAIQRLFYYSGEKIINYSESAEIFKLFLITFTYTDSLWKRDDIDSVFQMLDQLWKSKSISFDLSYNKVLKKVLRSIESQQSLYTVANILIDLNDFSFFYDFDSLLETVGTDVEYEDCLKDLVQRLLNEFFSGNKEISHYSGNLFVNIINTIADNCPEFTYISDFIDLLTHQNPFKISKKTLEAILKKKSIFVGDTSSGLPISIPNTTEELRQMSTEDLLDYAKTNISKKDHALHLVTVKVPKTGPFNTTYVSDPFIECGYEWMVEFLPVDEDEDYGNCSIFLTLNSTINHNEETGQFDRIRIEFSIRNFDMDASSYLIYSRKFDMILSSYGLFVEKQYVEPFSTRDEEFLIFKFFIGMKQITDTPIANHQVDIESFHKGRKELSTTNYPPLIHRMASEFPISIHTIVFRLRPENVGKVCYSDQFEAFGVKFSPRFTAMDNPQNFAFDGALLVPSG